MTEQKDLKQQLFGECDELLVSISDQVHQLRVGGSSDEGAASEMILRDAHTLKGLIGFLEDTSLLSHCRELHGALNSALSTDEPVAPWALDESAGLVNKALQSLRTKRAGCTADSSEGPSPLPGVPWRTFGSGQGETVGPWHARLLEMTCSALDRTLDGSMCCESTGADQEISDPANIMLALEGHPDCSIVLSFPDGAAGGFADAIYAGIAGSAGPAEREWGPDQIRDVVGEFMNQTAHAALQEVNLAPTVGIPIYCGPRILATHPDRYSVVIHSSIGPVRLSVLPGSHWARVLLHEPQEIKSEQVRMRAVVADDSTIMRQLVQNVLSGAGHEIVGEAANGQEAVELYRTLRPDFITLDISMPVMSGLDALRIIRTEDPEARVLICSAVASQEMMDSCATGGALGYLTKPFTADRLETAVERLFEARPVTERQTPTDVPRQLGNCRIRRLLGEGGMGSVYLAHDPSLDRELALKVLKSGADWNADSVIRFMDEAKAMARIDHPNIVRVYNAGSDQGHHYIAMELLPGPDLDDLIDSKGPLSWDDAVRYIYESAKGLAAAHAEGLLHLDVKPANLILDQNGCVKVTDFGLAQATGSGSGDSSGGMIIGTPWFMAPERIVAGTYDERADMYALGISLYFLTTGRLPYQGDDETEILIRHVHDPIPDIPGVPVEVNRLFHSLAAKQPENRPETYPKLLNELEKILP